MGAALALAVAWHFLALRIHGGDLLGGDEGSWISVGSEIAHGQGFTTRWLEAHFLLPYTIPRPDDFRYPVLTSLLALSFKVFGFSIETARWTVAWVFFAFAASTWLVSRQAFGRWAAMAGLWIMASSLLQLEWNAAVYTEGLFGLIVTGLAAWSIRGERSMQGGGAPAFLSMRTLGWWAILGAGVGILYMVRVNGILFLSGVAWLYWSKRKSSISWKHPAAALAAFTLVAAPWLIRTWMHFGSPFHIAGSAGLLREPGQTHTLNIAQYLANHDVLFPLRRIVVGTFEFFQYLHHYDHGLEAAPLILAACALILRRRFPSPFLTAAFLLTFAASAYASYHSWAGVRYMSGLIPFVYAYGLSLVPSLFPSRETFAGLAKSAAWSKFSGMLPFVAGVLAILLLLLPVLHPHRFYERKFSQRIAVNGPYPYRQDLAEHLSRLASRLPPGGRYYAASLCNVNFLLPERGCVGLQELYDPTWFSRSLTAFRPSLIALTHAETRSAPMLAALERMRSEGYAPDTLEHGAMAVYLSLRLDSARARLLP
ncbi:MAG: glycosyltransferase family 39 protein [Fibrobacterota bacterium]|nr:glycosyltransferase family 39 protein [Fibrobacterota bacterium]